MLLDLRPIKLEPKVGLDVQGIGVLSVRRPSPQAPNSGMQRPFAIASARRRLKCPNGVERRQPALLSQPPFYEGIARANSTCLAQTFTDIQ